MNEQAIRLVANELLNRGVKPEVVSGALAGLMGESGTGLNPLSFNDKDPGGGSGGIGQWNRERLVGPTGMLAYAKAHGVDVDINTPRDSMKVPLAIQANYLGHELDTRYKSVLLGLQTLNTAEEGLTTWVNNYEVPADKPGAIAQRRQYIAQVAPLIGAKTPLVIAEGGGAGAAGAAGTAAGGGAAGGPGTPPPEPPNPWMSLGGMLANSLQGAGHSGGLGIIDPPDQPAIRSPALDANFAGAPNPVPAQFAGGVGSTLGNLAIQPQDTSLDIDSITSGAPSMTAMVGQVGGANQRYGDPRATPSPAVGIRYPGLG